MIQFHKLNNTTVAELTDLSYLISGPEEAIDLFADIGQNDCNRIIIRESNLHPDFFDLKTRVAGEILQKFSNYDVKLAIIGDFSKYPGKSLQDFIRECNRGRRIFFTDDLESALRRLE